MSINYKQSNRLTAIFIIAISFMIFAYSTDIEAETEVHFSGFANIGLTYAPNEKLAYRTSLLNEGREGLSLYPDSTLGLQLNTMLSDKLDIVGQVILQDRFDDHISNYVEMAFLRYRINRNWTAKLGRFSTRAYLFADYRYVGHALTWLRPPIELYSPVSAVGNMNGVQISYTRDVNFGVIKSGLSHGQTRLRNDNPSGPFRITYKNFSSVNIELQADQWRFQGAFLSAELDDVLFSNIEQLRTAELNVPAPLQATVRSIREQVIADGSRVNYLTAGLVYNKGNFKFIAEVADYKSDWSLAASSITTYASVSYNFGNITPYLVVADVNRKEYPQVIDPQRLQTQLPPTLFLLATNLAQGVNDSVQAASYDQSSLSLGCRWDINYDWALKLQFDHYRSAAFGSGLFANVDELLAPSVPTINNVVAINLTTTF